MPIITSPAEFTVEDLYIDLSGVIGQALYLKCEGMNLAGSIKLKPAVEMVEAAEREGLISAGTVLVESSSGNLGVALSVVAASRGYRFTCVTDVRCNPLTVQLMRALGAEVHVVEESSPDQGFLGARLAYVRELCARDDRYLWLNQYANASNWQAHYRRTAPAIAREFPGLDVLFVGAGTTGTLMGCARYFRRWAPRVHVVAVDSVGSVTFGGPPGPRVIPGLGTGVRPEIVDESFVDEVVYVREEDAVLACRGLAARGLLLGGSTGTVVSGAASWLAGNGSAELVAVAISPDLGERYLDTVYADEWVGRHFGEALLSGPPCEPALT